MGEETPAAVQPRCLSGRVSGPHWYGGRTARVHLPSGQQWEYFDSEIPKKEIFQDVGDAAFRGGRQIYVRVGEAVFWIHTSGEVMVDMAIEAARLVARRLRDGQSNGDDS